MELTKINEMSVSAYNRYKKNISKDQKTTKNMFMLGYQSALIENSKEIEILQNFMDSSLGLLCTDKNIKTIVDKITFDLSNTHGLKSIDSFDINQYLVTYLQSITFTLTK